MRSTATQIAEKRIIGSLEGDPDGPTVILLGGMHGNEPAGVRAAEHIFRLLGGIQPSINGRLIGIRANMSALRQRVRYIDEDMNRLWFPAIIDDIRNKDEHQIRSSERREMKKLLKIIDEIESKTQGPVILADLHTFSAEGYMFSITNTDPVQRRLLSNLHVPMVFGIDKSLRGTALRYYQKKGHISFGLEGGQHQHKLTGDNITSAIILLLQAAGCIEEKYVAEINEYQDYLQSQTKHLPIETELVYQHIIEPGDRFVMRPGYKNFQPITKGEWLASDKDGKIYARCNGYMLMPLYQSQGNDGFFIIKEHEG
jgi:succinylglutamate desuccinylase